jgi:predicted nucleic acid-binding protein
MKVMLDSNIFDAIIKDASLIDHLNALSAGGRLTILTTHVQEDELAQIPDPVKREQISKIRRTYVRTAGGVWGVSKYGMSTWGDGSQSGCSIGEIDSTSHKHTADALIATTASADADVLVTNDDRLPKRMAETQARCKVWKFEEFRDHIDRLLAT